MLLLEEIQVLISVYKPSTVKERVTETLFSVGTGCSVRTQPCFININELSY